MLSSVCIYVCISAAFSALTLWVGHQEEHLVCKNWAVRWWCGYLSGARCRLFAYGPADPTAIPKPHHLLPHTHPFSSPFSGTTWVSRYQKGKTNLDFTEARDSECQWHQLGHMQVCTLLQTDNHASTPPLRFFTDALPAAQPTASKPWRQKEPHLNPNPDWFHLSGIGLLRLSWKRGR